jgi:hypothetical protein
MKKKMLVVSYWCGDLPKVSELHFRSFLFDENVSYKLYIDTDKSKGVIQSFPAEISWIESMPNLEVKYFSLDELLTKHSIHHFSPWKNTLWMKSIRRILSYVFRNIYQLAMRLRINLDGVKVPGFGSFSSIGHWSFTHAAPFSGLSDHLTYRSDLFRSVIALEFPERDLLYVDVDTCLVKPIIDWDFGLSFASQWGTGNFANTACLFFSSHSQTRHLVAEKLRYKIAAWPWVLYSFKNCKDLGIEIRPIKLFDPAWTPGTLLEGNSAGFFHNQFNVKAIVEEIEENCLLAHWHNQWTSVPEPESPYVHLLRKYL